MIETSYGIIPLRKHEGDIEVFLIHQKSRLGDTFWTFPKGHTEVGETQEETSLRELKEETGLEAKIDSLQSTYTQAYSFEEKGQIIEKTVVYFVGWVVKDGMELQQKEVVEGGWFTFDEARGRLTYERLREILAEVEVLVSK